MKKYYLYIILLSTINLVYAQIGPDDAGALLGLPQATDLAEINLITNPQIGSIVYNIDDGEIYRYSGITNSWEKQLSTEHSGTTGSIFFADTTANNGVPTEDNANLFWDNTSKYLGIGTNLPETSLDIVAPSTVNDRGTLRITGNDPDIVLNDTDGGNNTLTYKTNGDNKAFVGTNTVDDFFISIFNTGFDDDAFTIRNSNSNVGISVAQANSTLQVNGSVSKSIFTTTAATALGASHHTVILGGNHNIGLPAANTCEGRIYIIKNNTSNTPVIDSYLDLANTAKTTIPSETALWIQSNGTNWEQISPEGQTKAAKIFYPPSIAIDAGTISANTAAPGDETKDLYQEYLDQFSLTDGATSTFSAGAPSAIPTYLRTELYYYITYYDNSIFSNVAVNANGELTYDIIAIPTDDNTIINVVFVVK